MRSSRSRATGGIGWVCQAADGAAACPSSAAAAGSGNLGVVAAAGVELLDQRLQHLHLGDDLADLAAVALARRCIEQIDGLAQLRQLALGMGIGVAQPPDLRDENRHVAAANQDFVQQQAEDEHDPTADRGLGRRDRRQQPRRQRNDRRRQPGVQDE